MLARVLIRVGLLGAVLMLTAVLTAAAPDPDAEMPAWPFVLGAVAAVAVVAIWSVRRRP
ncbi:hypothetical protein [Mycobacterium asiaticum]|uniref:hypothetical protein n=1 Tax=Mycobacterium asiaticum TaxID=1790 RepID=UPI000ACD5F7F|nr:hypothetical protein [Mycobacterium asiaticum]